MRKTTLLTATAIILTCFGGQTFTAQAATEDKNRICLGGNRIIVTYKSDCNIKDILDKLENCFPGISLPECELPGENTPETDAPETEKPETDIPENNTPETDLPDNNTPGNTPGNDSAEENIPGDNVEGEHAFIKQVVTLVNIERAKEGLSPLTVDARVQAAAMVRAKECERLFSHTRPDGSSFATALKEQNVAYRSAGENIAWGQQTPKEVVTAWMNSSGHRANIMNPNFTTIGVGYYENARGTDYWCQLFTR